MTDQRPIRLKRREFAHNKRVWLEKEIKELLEANIIRPSRSPYAAAPVIVAKKDGTWRFAVDYRKVNQRAEDFLFLLPRISEILDCFGGATYFSTIDLARGYWQIAMHPDSIKYTAFMTPNGQYEFTVMPFGLKQTPGWFQLLMNTVLQPYINKICVVYLDDMIIYSKNFEQHKKDLKTIFKALYQSQLQIKLRKCKFFLKKVKFLGHEISGDGIKTDPEKIRVMQELPEPKNLKNVQEVMGLFQYYKSFVK